MEDRTKLKRARNGVGDKMNIKLTEGNVNKN